MKLNEKVMDFLKNNKVWNIATYGEDGAHVVPCFIPLFWTVRPWWFPPFF